MSNEIYVLVNEWQFDSGELGQDVLVFDTFEKAKTEMKKLVKQAQKDMKDYQHMKDDYTDSCMSWAIWEMENYCFNHISITIYQREIL